MSEARQAQDETIKQLEETHGVGRIAFARLSGGALLVCRAPTPEEHRRMSDKMSDSRKSDYSAQREYVMTCRAHPERADFVALLDRYPALVQKMTDALFDLASDGIEIETGK